MERGHDVENYMLGKGILYFAPFDENGVNQGEIDLGNVPSFNVSLALEKLPHYSSRSGLRVKDKEVITQVEAPLSLQLEEFNLDNLKLAFMGEDYTYSQTAGSITDESVTALAFDSWFKLEKRVITAASVVVTSDPAGTTYVEGTDYEVDYTIGRIKFINTGVGIDLDDPLLVSYDITDKTLEGVKFAASTSKEGLLRFVGDPAQGEKIELIFWKVSLTPEGEVGFISEEWGNFTITAEVLADEENHPDEKYGVALFYAA